MDTRLQAIAEAAKGFMPPDEGMALYQAAVSLAVDGPIAEIGSYCGKSAVYLGAAAQKQGRLVFSVDHHRGSEELQPGWDHHDPSVVDPVTGLIDTLPFFRRTIHDADLEQTVIAIVGDSPTVASAWQTPLAMLFIDGGHSYESAHLDYDSWVPHLKPGGILAIHDVFEDPADGGQAPYELFQRALTAGFTPSTPTGSLHPLTNP